MNYKNIMGIYKKILKRISDTYLIEKKESITANSIAYGIRHTVPIEIKKLANIDDNYKVYGSPGTGGWSEIPWIAILDKEITNTVQNGYYICYLYSSDMKSVYLTLALGWMQFENKFGSGQGRIQIKNYSKGLSKKLISSLIDFKSGEIDLKANTPLGKGYENGIIYFKKYITSNLPEDDVLISDLWKLIGVYRELKGRVGNNIFDINVDLLIEEADENEIKKEIINSSFSINTPEEAMSKIAELDTKILNTKVEVKQRLAKYMSRVKKYSDWVKERDSYICQICGAKPFIQNNGKLYAEAHHTLELSFNRIDDPNSMITLCPTCHEVVHWGNKDALAFRKALKTK